jgi:hypothetical protein
VRKYNRDKMIPLGMHIAEGGGDEDADLAGLGDGCAPLSVTLKCSEWPVVVKFVEFQRTRLSYSW